MKRIPITDDCNFSQLSYGCWRLKNDPSIRPEDVRDRAAACLDLGISTFDHADIYGNYEAEEFFGTALRGSGLLARMEIVTKCGIIAPAGRYSSSRLKHYDTSAGHIQTSVESSLRLLGVEVIDLLLLHRPDPFMDHQQTGGMLDALIQSGKIRAAGVSNFKPHDIQLLAAGMENRLCVNQIEVSLAHHHPLTNGDIAYLQRQDMPIMAWSPLAGGAIFQDTQTKLAQTLLQIAAEEGCSPGVLALRWLLAHPAHIMPIIGSNSTERIADLATAAHLPPLDRQTWFALYTAALGHRVP